MQDKNHALIDLFTLKRVLVSVTILMMLVLGGVAARPATAQPSAGPFEANFTGEFWIAGDVGKSVLFIVEETGSGQEQALGNFSYAASLRQNLARTPPGCGPNSSTGVDGSAVLSFADGEITLKRTSGTVCFAFPFINVEENWVITSGTGSYTGTTGQVSRQLAGDVRSGTTEGTISGVIKLN
ncbi:MAG: hypothetical protein DPW09_19205 [Anaerolineae bacterium]|nr:hypothetical protein [Anaerolineae bacterium]MCQ3975570.1 hypothetical protein [Anaerolineae bacterium]